MHKTIHMSHSIRIYYQNIDGNSTSLEIGSCSSVCSFGGLAKKINKLVGYNQEKAKN